jgi:PLD-like domain
MTEATGAAEAPHIAAVDGNELRRNLLSLLQWPYLRKAVILSFRYNDFDLQSGRKDTRSATTNLVRLLERAAMNNVDLTVVTRDPFGERDLPTDFHLWYSGLLRLVRAGATVRLHPALHAKVYLLQSDGGRSYFAVGSSNLTFQGMGQRWAECNVRGYHSGEYELVFRHAMKLSFESGAQDFHAWERTMRRSPRGQDLLRRAGA